MMASLFVLSADSFTAEQLRSIGDDSYREQFLINQMAKIRHQRIHLFKLMMILGMTMMYKISPLIKGILFLLVASELCDNPVLQNMFQNFITVTQMITGSSAAEEVLTYELPFTGNPDEQLYDSDVGLTPLASSSCTNINGEGAALNDLDSIPSLSFYPTPVDMHEKLDWFSSW